MRFTVIIFFMLIFAGTACNNAKVEEEDISTKDSSAVEQKDTSEIIIVADTNRKLINKRNKLIKGFVLEYLLEVNSEKELISLYGKTNVRRSLGYLPNNSGQYKNTILFPGTKNKVEFVWNNDSSYSDLKYIHIDNSLSEWATKDKIRIGTDLKTLEKVNEETFKFFGFGGDYSGKIDWNGGELGKRKFAGSLKYPFDTVDKNHLTMWGDQTIKSDSPLAQKVNPTLHNITIYK